MIQSMIFAAGLGTRLKPLTDTKPKALVEVGGKTLLQHTIETVSAAGAERIVVNVHHFAGQIKDFLKATRFDADIIISDESDKLLDTGGGIKKAASLFKPLTPVLIHNVDILSNADLKAFHTSNASSDAALLVSHRPTSRYLLFDDAMRLVGWTNTATGEVRSPYDNLNPADCRRYAFAGIHLISARLIAAMDSWPDTFGIVDFYLANCRHYSIRGHVQDDLRLLDVGKPEALEEAARHMRQTGTNS